MVWSVSSVPFSKLWLTLFFFFFNDTATTEIYTLSLHDALPISAPRRCCATRAGWAGRPGPERSEEHTSELQSHSDLVCRLLLEKKKTKKSNNQSKITKKKKHTNKNQEKHT